MKQFLYTFIFSFSIVLFATEGLAQEYIPLPEDNAIWTEMNGIYEGYPPQIWTSLFKTETDTILLGKTYKCIYEYYIKHATNDTVKELYASIRQDVDVEKVYIIRHYLGETKERLLMDFSVKAGDTLHLDAYYWDIDPLHTDSTFVVDSISEIRLGNNQARRIQYLRKQNAAFSQSQIIIEGVGSIFNPFGPTTDLVNKQKSRSNLCCPDYLVCLTVDGEHIYVRNDDETYCSLLLNLTSTDERFSADQISLFPNPSDGLYRIKISGESYSEKLLEIFDLSGRKLIENRFYENDIRIDLSSLKAGTYLTKLWYDGTVVTNKLIISQ